jgi:hypothetical protein
MLDGAAPEEPSRPAFSRQVKSRLPISDTRGPKTPSATTLARQERKSTFTDASATVAE